jgi:two-component system, chemotaxis family, CheB/CheR fusion protein
MKTTTLYEPSSSFPIVGIGASAGGLKAFTQLLEQLPTNTGMAYVVIQHLDPSHASLLPLLLARVTTMPVHEGQDDMVVEPNQVYVIPPQADMVLLQGTLILQPRSQESGQHFAINTFFRSLAHERKRQAIGVLLSGTATDGTVGLQIIRAEGGITFAQEKHSASFPQMPLHAIAAGCVDHVLPPGEIARALTRLRLHPSTPQKSVMETAETQPAVDQNLTSILLVLRNAKGVDFLSYKQATLQRRIVRRMAGLQIEQFAEYATYLREHPAEIEVLYQQILISVTSFFRDEAPFLALINSAFPTIVQHLSANETMRIWIPGCSTGEEVYSLAMCLLEFLEERSLKHPFLIFATDINPAVLRRARAGVYPTSALSAVSPQRLKRFFTPFDRNREHYRICEEIREQCLFTLHDMTKDPPFSRLDLVSCRNVLIYLGPTLQQKVIQTFHYALKPHGFLLLGISENVGLFSRLFAPVEQYLKLSAKKATEGSPFLSPVKNEERSPLSISEGGSWMFEETRQNTTIQQEVDRLLLANYVPACVIIDAEMEILHVRGHTGPYLELAPGKTSFNLLKMAREGLRLGLRSAIHSAKQDNHMVTKDGLLVTAAGTTREVRVTVLPLQDPSIGRSFLVLFEEVSTPLTPSLSSSGEQTNHSSKRSVAARRIASLEQELATTRTEMQSLLEDRDATNEELQAANEEIRASNEELQSFNEELETSKAELQAINEELIITNQELHTRNGQLKAANEYAESIVETVREPLVILSEDLRVLRANTSFYQSFQAVPQETEGRALDDLGNGQWNISRLHTLFEQILTTNQSFHDFEVEQTFPIIGRKMMILNARRLLREHEQGGKHLLLLAIEDITERKEAERQKDALLALVSHELKTPLTSVKGFVQLLRLRMQKEGDKQTATELGRIDALLDRMAHRISDLRDETTLEAGALRLRLNTFAIDDLVREVVEELGNTVPPHRLLIEGTTHAEVHADRERTEQVLMNVLSNAIKYAPEAEPIEVSVVADEEMVTVRVRDHGPGIPEDQQAQIFERYYRVTGSQQTQVVGLGLGLYLAAEIVKRQGGQIWVESIEEGGATFSFTLPRNPVASIHEERSSVNLT